jgi:hypothetical protein
MNESSLTEVHRRRLLTQVNPRIPANVTPKTSTPHERPVAERVPSSPGLPPEAEYKPLSTREKFRIATLDSFDRGTVALGCSLRPRLN